MAKPFQPALFFFLVVAVAMILLLRPQLQSQKRSSIVFLVMFFRLRHQDGVACHRQFFVLVDDQTKMPLQTINPHFSSAPRPNPRWINTGLSRKNVNVCHTDQSDLARRGHKISSKQKQQQNDRKYEQYNGTPHPFSIENNTNSEIHHVSWMMQQYDSDRDSDSDKVDIDASTDDPMLFKKNFISLETHSSRLKFSLDGDANSLSWMSSGSFSETILTK